MIIAYENGKQFQEDNEEILSEWKINTSLFRSNSKYINKITQDDWCFKVKKDDQYLLFSQLKPYSLSLFGSIDLIKEGIDYIIKNNLIFNEVLAEPNLAKSFLDEYKKCYGGTYRKKLGMDLMICKNHQEIIKYNVQKFEECDIEEISSLFIRFSSEVFRLRPTNFEAVKDKIKKDLNAYYGIKINNQIASIAKITRNEEDICSLSDVYTRKEYRGLGLTTSIVSYITKVIISQNKTPYLYVDKTNPISNAIYQKIGYVAIEEKNQYLYNAGNNKKIIIFGKNVHNFGHLVLLLEGIRIVYFEKAEINNKEMNGIVIIYDDSVVSLKKIFTSYLSWLGKTRYKTYVMLTNVDDENYLKKRIKRLEYNKTWKSTIELLENSIIKTI